MQKSFTDKCFVRYADDIVVHCKSEKQAHFLLDKIRERLASCKLEVHPVKTKIVNLRGYSSIRYARSFDFLGFTLRPHWSRTNKGLRLTPYVGISRKSVSRILEKFKCMQIHKWRKPIEELAAKLSSVIRGVMNYYRIGAAKASVSLWNQLNLRLLKWVKWEKRLPKEAALSWLRKKYRQKPALFPHWKLVYP
ncbi:RNA-directed DNA polymerase [Flammeovirgaceae bacterium 311]|nr:RNA-directed DNA polymerase [Flammeovirgaceae bacterium 311]